jgi:membrane protease YdiL (CAAX protease family)
MGGATGAIILTSVIFSAIHISYYGFLVRFALGVILGYIFYYSGSIWLSSFLHFLFNGFQVTAMYLAKDSGKLNGKGVEENFHLWAGVPALVVLIIVFYLFKKESLRVSEKFVYREPDDPDDIQNWIAKN